MKTLITFLLLGMLSNTYAQYYQKYYNLNFATPLLREEVFNSGIKTTFNFKSGKPKNYYSVGVGSSYNLATLPAPHNKADRLRFVSNKKDGSTVYNNYGYEFDDPLVTGYKPFHSHGNSIAEADNGKGTGGYIAAGNVTSNPITGAFAPGGSDVLYTHLDSNGAVVSAVRLDFMGNTDIAWCVRRSVFMPGTFIICGQSAALSGAYTNCIVARLDVSGAVLWAFSYNFDPTPIPVISAHCAARQLCEDPISGGIFVVGTLRDAATLVDVDGLAFALTPVGGVVWANTYNLASDDEFKADRLTDDGNIIVGGHSNYTPSGSPMVNMLLTKIKSSNGSIIFQTILRATGPTAASTFDSKCFDLVQGTPLTGTASPSYYLVGPVYRSDGTFQMMYKTDGAGIGINNYHYNKMKIDSLFGIDLETSGKKGIIVASSIVDPSFGFSDAHILKTYSNGAACTNYCPANPPLNISITMQVIQRQHFDDQQRQVQPLAPKRYNYSAVLMCNQASIACGALIEKSEPAQVFKTETISPVWLFPNPAKSLINVDLSGLLKGKYEMTISDLTGKVVKTVQIETGLNKSILQVDVSHLQSGVYVLIFKGDITIKPIRFVKE